MKASVIEKTVLEKLKKLEVLLGRKIPQRYKKVFITAITHSSFSGEYKDFPSNEKLEFLGDSVLSLAITHYLITHYKEFREGDLSKKRAFIVSEKSLAEKASTLNIGEVILFGKGEIKTGGRCKKAVLADTFESIIAAVFLAFGINEAEKFVQGIFKQELLDVGAMETADYKSRLQEVVQKKFHVVPEYEIAGEEVVNGIKVFTSLVKLNGEKIGVGKGRTKKEAEESAAMEALKSETFRED
jgi:ribonuclease-3